MFSLGGFICFRVRITCILVWLQTSYTAKEVLELLPDPVVLTYQVLGSQECAGVSGSQVRDLVSKQIE